MTAILRALAAAWEDSHTGTILTALAPVSVVAAVLTGVAAYLAAPGIAHALGAPESAKPIGLLALGLCVMGGLAMGSFCIAAGWIGTILASVHWEVATPPGSNAGHPPSMICA